MIANWTMAGSALLPEKHASNLVHDIIASEAVDKTASYSSLFDEEDVRRSQYTCVYVYMAYIKKDDRLEYFREPSHPDIGRVLAFMPNVKEHLEKQAAKMDPSGQFLEKLKKA